MPRHRHRVRSLPSRELHGLTGRLMVKFHGLGLSGPEEWLLDVCMAELDYRWWHGARYERCYCEWCFSPFPY